MNAKPMTPQHMTPKDQAALDRRADDLLNDTRHAALRRRTPRRALAATLMALPLLHLPLQLWDSLAGSVLVVANLLAVMALWFVLQRVNRGFVDLPDPYVDERIQYERGITYRLAWWGAAAVLATFGTGAIVLDVLDRPLSTDWLVDITLSGGIFAFVLPNAIFAWQQPEL